MLYVHLELRQKSHRPVSWFHLSRWTCAAMLPAGRESACAQFPWFDLPQTDTCELALAPTVPSGEISDRLKVQSCPER